MNIIGKAGAGRTAIAAAAVLTFWAATGDASAQTLHEAIRRSLATNPEVAAIRHNRLATVQGLEGAKGALLPSVDLAGGLGPRWVDGDKALVDGTRVTRLGRTQRVDPGVGITQTLYDGGEATSEIRRQAERVDSANHRAADTANSIALRTVQAYMECQRAAQVATVAQRNVEGLASLLERVRQREAGGSGNGAEVNLASARVEAARAALAEAQSRQRDAATMFRAVVGEEPRRLSPKPVPARPLPPSIEAAVEQASGAPSVRATLADARSADAAVDGARARLGPRLDLQLGSRYAYGLYAPSDHYRRDLSAVVVLRQNLYHGGTDIARTAEAQERAYEAREVARNARVVIEREVRLAWSAVTASRQRRAALARQFAQNRQAFERYLQQYDVGQRTLIDLLELQNETFLTETNLVTEEYAGRYGTFRVLGAMGVLLADLGLERPGLSEGSGDHPLPAGAL